MAYEIDFLPVGDGERSGDAIALRFGDLQAGQQTVVVIDGGTKESGQALVQHVKTFYGAQTVNAAFCTHSDADHASGLTEVLESLKVERLFMHLPWKHADNIDDLFKDPRVTTSSLMRNFKKSLDNAHALAALAEKKGIPIFEPFSDTVKASANFAVLGPSKAFYEELLVTFRCSPEPAEEPGLLQKAVVATKEAVRWQAETLHIETLGDPADGECSAENDSSVVLFFRDGEHGFLFTSDAGVRALTNAVACATQLGIDLTKVKGIQIPHHGSKHNVGPSVLDQLIGPKRADGTYSKTAIVSAATQGAPKHPHKKVVNAFMRRGAYVYATQGKPLCHYNNGAYARGWSKAVALPFAEQVEE
jgi:beta-lactamase superfamily II metal-dependent hydrolase